MGARTADVPRRSTVRRLQGEPWSEGPDLAPAEARAPRWHDLERRLDAEGERRFLFAPVLLGCGIALFFGLRQNPSALATLLLAALFAAAAWRLSPGSPSRHLAAACLLVTCGLLLAMLRTWSAGGPVVPDDPRPRALEAWVERVEEDADRGDRVTLRLVSAEGLTAEEMPRRAAIRSRVRGAVYVPGTTVRLRAVLLPPPDAARPGGFDYARFVFFSGLGATGYAISRPEAISVAPPGRAAVLAARVETLRDTIGRRIRAAMSPVAGAVATALVTGQRSHIPEATEDALRRAGLAHILAISGLHMMLVVGALFAGFRTAAAMIPEIALTRPVKKWAAAAALAGGTAYLVISGWSIATQRAYVMAAVLLVAVLLDRPAITMRNVALAALAILALRPEAVVTAGFQMSFAATIALVAAYEALRLRRAALPPRPGAGAGASRGLLRMAGVYVAGLLLTSLVAGTATAPFAAYHFQRVATYGLLANLAAMPVFALVVMPAGLVAMLLMPFGLEWPALWLMGQGIEVILQVAGVVAGLDGASRAVPAFGPSALLLMALGALWLALWRTGWRYLGCAAIAAGLLVAWLARAPDVFVARSGRIVAVHEPDGRVLMVGRGGSDYEREEWLSAWGLPADEETAAAPCDAPGLLRGGRPPAALRRRGSGGLRRRLRAGGPRGRKAGRAGILPRGRPRLTASDLAASGAVAITVESRDGGPLRLTLQTASGRTGPRPWNWRWRANGPPTLPAQWPASQ